MKESKLADEMIRFAKKLEETKNTPYYHKQNDKEVFDELIDILSGLANTVRQIEIDIESHNSTCAFLN